MFSRTVEMMNGEITNYDIALLGCIRTWGKKEIIEELRSLISFMDYYDHSILSFEEFSVSMKKLQHCGIISPKEKGFSVHEDYLRWYSKQYAKKQVGLQKELKETKEFIDKSFRSPKEQLNQDKFPISKDEFDAAVKLYLKME